MALGLSGTKRWGTPHVVVLVCISDVRCLVHNVARSQKTVEGRIFDRFLPTQHVPNVTGLVDGSDPSLTVSRHEHSGDGHIFERKYQGALKSE